MASFTPVQKVIPFEGEITINLNLTIKLDSDGLSIDVDVPKKSRKEKDETKFVVPDLEFDGIINLGQEVEKI